MLARSFLKKSGDHAVAHHHHAPPPAEPISTTAPYYKHTTIDIHPHHEPNFRVKPAGWAGWGPKYADPFAPFGVRSPMRHYDRQLMGIHYGAGHVSLKYMGRFYWKFWCRLAFFPIGGFSFGWFCWWQRMARNGWLVLNKSAVSGGD